MATKHYSLKEVIAGLKADLSFKRTLENDEEDENGNKGAEYLTPIGGGYVYHDVVGNAHGGWGGAAELPMAELDNGRWGDDGWELNC